MAGCPHDTSSDSLALLRSLAKDAERLELALATERGKLEKADAVADSWARDAAAGRALWAHLIETRDAWGEYQDTFVELGLLARVAVPKDLPAEDRCEDCDGDCDWCYQPTELLAAGRKEGGGG